MSISFALLCRIRCRKMEPFMEFAVTTSVKGIPRAVKCRSKPMRLLWTVCIIGFLTAAILQATALTIDYFRYGTTTTIAEYRIDLRDRTKDRVYFPDVSFCNINPFGGHSDAVQGVPPLKEFYDRVKTVTSCDNCSSSQRHQLEHLRKALLTPAAYSVFIGPDNVRKIGHTLESILVDCQLIVVEGRLLTQVPCFPVTQVTYRYDLKYYNCYTLQLPTPSFAGHLFVGISMVLHLDNHFKEFWVYLDTSDAQTRMGGLHLNLHTFNSIPWGDVNGLFLPPGFLTNIKVTHKRHRRLKTPYGNCSDHFRFDLTTNRIYNRDYCSAFCIQHHVNKSCACVDYNIYTELNSLYKNLTSCLHLQRSREDLLQTYECTVRERQVAMRNCAQQCPIACEEISYVTQVGSISVFPLC